MNTEWHQHKGGGCPIPPNHMHRRIEVEFADGTSRKSYGHSVIWRLYSDTATQIERDANIVRWRYIEETAG